MSIIKKLQAIQSELEVPKSQYNDFGKYYYRSGEDILAAAKPLCIKHGCLLTVTDEIVQLNDRFYVKATARLLVDDKDDPSHIETTAYAREELTKRGMDAAQITGAASSYARKYALNGLFCLDDVEDADSINKHEPEKSNNVSGNGNSDWENAAITPEDVPESFKQAEEVFGGKPQNKSEYITEKQQKRLFALAGIKENKERATVIVKELLEKYKLKSTGEIKKSEYEEICQLAEEKLAEQLKIV